MTNPTAIATPAAPQTHGPASSDRTRKDAAANGPSFASVMRAQRGEADQGRSRSAAPGEGEALAAGTDTSGDAQHLPGLSSLQRRDWHSQFKTLASGEDEPQLGEGVDGGEAEMLAGDGRTPALQRKRAANSNALPPTSMRELESEQPEDMPKVGLAEQSRKGGSAGTEKTRRPQVDETAELLDGSPFDTVPVPPTLDQSVRMDTLAATKPDGAEAQSDKDAESAATAKADSSTSATDESTGAHTATASSEASHHGTPPPAQAAPAPAKMNATPVAPAFTVEMTVAAAKYALASGNAAQGTDRGTSETKEVGTETPSAERPRVTVLPTSAQVASPGLSSATFSMPPAFIADDQARQSAQATGAQEEIRTLGADKTADDSPRTRVEPETGAAIQSRAPSTQGLTLQQTQTSPTATVVAALAADPAARPQPISPLAQVLAPQSASEPKTLTIQLHPAELGVVYATFQMSGGQMSVEISAETDDARSRLAAESHTIAKSLRSLGIEVDQVTVLQTTSPVQSVARADETAAQNLPSGREQQSSFGDQTSGGGGSRLGGQQNGRNGHDMAGAGRDQPSAADRGDGGVYI